MKNKIIGIIIIISLILNITLTIIYIKQIKNNEPKYGYYINKDLDITNIDVLEHNAPFERYFIGKQNSEVVIKMIEYVQYTNDINYDNENKTICLFFKEEAYKKIDSGQLRKLKDSIKNDRENYYINVNYNQQTGFINEVIVTKI